jgi:cation diffusion facilitator family transporter
MATDAPAVRRGGPEKLTRYAWLSIAAALSTMAIKGFAAWLTSSVGLLSDALESSVNLVAAVVALVALTVADRPADEGHAYGHTKAEYFSAAIEGTMILVAAMLIVLTAVERLLHPVALKDVGVGLAVSVVAGAINLVVALVLRRAGTTHRSITLEADSKHLLTDVWTSVGVVVAVGVVALTGIERLDPVIALLVAANIVYSGVGLIRRSALGLMDQALEPGDLERVMAVLDAHTGPEVQFHEVLTRQSGRRSFMSVHVLVPGRWTVQQSHDLSEEVEEQLRDAVPYLHVVTHVEPLEDPRSFADSGLDAVPTPRSARPLPKAEHAPTHRLEPTDDPATTDQKDTSA